VENVVPDVVCDANSCPPRKELLAEESLLLLLPLPATDAVDDDVDDADVDEADVVDDDVEDGVCSASPTAEDDEEPGDAVALECSMDWPLAPR